MTFLGLSLFSCIGFENAINNHTYQSQRDIYLNGSTCALPCVFGITAGETNYSDALAIVNSTFPKEQIGYLGSDFWFEQKDKTQVNGFLHLALPNATHYVTSIELRAAVRNTG